MTANSWASSLIFRTNGFLWPVSTLTEITYIRPRLLSERAWTQTYQVYLCEKAGYGAYEAPDATLRRPEARRRDPSVKGVKKLLSQKYTEHNGFVRAKTIEFAVRFGPPEGLSPILRSCYFSPIS